RAAGFDTDPERIALAREVGIEACPPSGARALSRGMTQGRGFDAVILTAGSPRDLGDYLGDCPFPLMDYTAAVEIALLAYLDMAGETGDLRVPPAAQVLNTAYGEALRERDEKGIGFVYSKADGGFGTYDGFGRPREPNTLTPKGQILIVHASGISFLQKLFRLRGVEDSDPDTATREWLIPETLRVVFSEA
ncbi:MAG: hypothetical protein HYT89_07545, partial [Candidatus Omnitrophica bacterium]|nr:hypothetical protein [Candidatus Omnitrophota bacterium]